jgi:hypothetical protein
MSTVKISALNLLTQANLDSANDELPIVDDGAGETKKISPKSLVGGSLADVDITWNNVATTFKAFDMAVTDTASDGGSDRLKLTKDGHLTVVGYLRSSGANTGVGYATGAGGTVTQLTSKSTAVTLNKTCGAITMNNAQLNRSTAVSFTLNNTSISSGDAVIVNIKSGATVDAYTVNVTAVATNSCRIQLRNFLSGTDLSEAVVLTFAVIKAVTA